MISASSNVYAGIMMAGMKRRRHARYAVSRVAEESNAMGWVTTVCGVMWWCSKYKVREVKKCRYGVWYLPMCSYFAPQTDPLGSMGTG